jgi:methylated-DNA-[protein]-cysteine S-methyltransferase
MVTALAWASLDTPVGPVSVGCSQAGVVQVRFGPPPAGAAAGGELPAEAARQLGEYFRGQRRAFGLPVDWSSLTGTRKRVLVTLHTSVGYGETVTYGTLARRAGVADGPALPPARVVGQVMGSNRCPVLVPCHRVVAGNGLGGFSGGTGIELKRWLLEFEGALPPALDFDPTRMDPWG